MYLLHMSKTRFWSKTPLGRIFLEKTCHLFLLQVNIKQLLMGGVKVLKTCKLWVEPFYYHSKCKIHRKAKLFNFMALLFAWFMQKRYFFSCTLKDLQYIVVSVGQKILHCIWIVLVFDLVWDKVKSNSWPMYNILLILFQICTKMYRGGHTYLSFQELVLLNHEKIWLPLYIHWCFCWEPRHFNNWVNRNRFWLFQFECSTYYKICNITCWNYTISIFHMMKCSLKVMLLKQRNMLFNRRKSFTKLYL